MNSRQHTVEYISIEVAPSEQAVVLALGNGEIVMVDDRLVPGYTNLTPVQRAVWVARLRAIANTIEDNGE